MRIWRILSIGKPIRSTQFAAQRFRLRKADRPRAGVTAPALMNETDEGLTREIRKWDLVALLVNVTVGAGIFRPASPRADEPRDAGPSGRVRSSRPNRSRLGNWYRETARRPASPKAAGDSRKRIPSRRAVQ